MNYILSSIILLVVTIIIIYLFSIDNNIDKFKNKMKETFTTIKSDKINYLNDTDSSMLLHFLKSYYNTYDNIMIPRKVFYCMDKTNNGYILEEVQIIGFKLQNNTFIENNHTITIKFIPIKNELFVGRYTLFGKNGNFYIELDDKPVDVIVDIPEKKLSKKKNKSKSNTILSEVKDMNTATDILDMIPDIIHLSSDVEENTDRITTVTPQKNRYA